MHSVIWDQAVKINSADPDRHRRDLWEAILTRDLPEWDLGLQIFDQTFADRFDFDVLDPTKLIPEDVLPMQIVGTLTLYRTADNFFEETKQVAFCTQNVIPGIDFTYEPLLQGRNLSYLDTQIKRLGSPNFIKLPINAPAAALSAIFSRTHTCIPRTSRDASTTSRTAGGRPQGTPSGGVCQF